MSTTPKLLPFVTGTAPADRRPNMFRSLGIALTGMSSQRLRMETIATNIANAETTRTAEGQGPYRRRVVRMETAEAHGAPPQFPALLSPDGTIPTEGQDPTSHLGGVRVAAIEEDSSEGPLVYDPGHPDANAQGYVRYPNVRVTDEMVELMEARRAYEANASVFNAAKALLRRAIEI